MKQVRLFTDTDFKKEAAYLAKMHAKGWKLSQVTRFYVKSYHFEETQPEDYVYQLDFTNSNAYYIQMMEDMGWEFVACSDHVSYLRKPLSSFEKAESHEIYSDVSSHLSMVRKHLFYYILVGIFGVLSLFYSLSSGIAVFFSNPLATTLSLVYLLLCSFYLLGLVRIIKTYLELKKM